MRLRGHFIGALTLAFISLACASANAKSTNGAADEHATHHAAQLPTTNRSTLTRLEGFATDDRSLAELSDLSQLYAAR